jgi:hypothetical protein
MNSYSVPCWQDVRPNLVSPIADRIVRVLCELRSQSKFFSQVDRIFGTQAIEVAKSHLQLRLPQSLQSFGNSALMREIHTVNHSDFCDARQLRNSQCELHHPNRCRVNFCKRQIWLKLTGMIYSSKLCPKFLPWAADPAQAAHWEM